MKTSSKILIIALCTLILASLAACSPKSQIIGKWKEQTTGAELEFFKDGTVTLKMVLTSIGQYSFLDSNTISMELSGLLSLAGAQTYTVKIEKDIMTLTSGGVVLTFDRVKE